ncbi:hypothetical protein [Serratia marcescens]|uniref:hypothetical protein n=1 Tax=Serratia marcescens TaxID=615 RepID=UPI0013782C24|nr:hypothetical protein [Serratia marcescens]MBH3207553.1 hypothetical protein [Serratia marcescens]NCI54416.1 hypothetical protein [Serratia marcescens]NDJ05683.1 hypothetical protein [Serratia marcescens]NDJ29965.1 hypothetical protein [Serratia marcescens]NDJ42840.1 hypothetical protein [Serratia marcescens]
MKERPVIFNGEMVRAIIDGRKTQTRRIMAVQPESNQFGLLRITDSTKRSDIGKYHWAESNATGTHQRSALFSCPFGQVGDRLWVRETFAVLGNEDGCPIDWDGNLIKGDEKQAARIYKASCWQEPGNYGLWSIPDRDTQYEGTWRPSIHMPRWASRILLEITAVRVERLSDISVDDAKAEGVRALENNFGNGPAYCDYLLPNLDDTAEWYNRASDSFKSLWKSIYGAESWRANPWVWVIEFRRVGGSDASK